MNMLQVLNEKAGLVFPAISILTGLALANSIDPYLAYVATSWVIFGLLGLSLDIVWGRGGFLSLAQTAFYGLGGYFGSVAAINLSFVFGSSVIWSLSVGMISGALIAGALGLIIFYARMGPLQSTILSYTFTLLLWSVSQSFKIRLGDAVIGGDNGMSGIPGIVLAGGTEALDPKGALTFTILVAGAAYFVTYKVMTGTFGRVIDCVRLDIQKTELLGYDVRRYQVLNFAFSGGIAGLAGALFGAWSNYLNPSIFSVQEALLVPIYVLVGGLGTLAGPFVGAIAIGGLSFWLGGGAVGGQTTLILGIVLVLLVLFLKNGVLGALRQGMARLLPDPNEASRNAGAVSIETGDLEGILQAAEEKEGPAKALSSAGLLKKFGGVVPVNDVTLSFEPGKPHSLIGPNGAGKSSFLKTCVGLYKPDGGHVTLGGEPITNATIYSRVHTGMGVKNQKPQVFSELKVRDNLWIAAFSRLRDKRQAHDVATTILDMLGLTEQADVTASALSHGQQQWLDIGMVLCLAPRVVLLDEPAAGMTNEETRELAKLVRILARFTTVIVVEHDMEFVRTLQGHVTVLHQGEVFADGDIDQLRADERVLDIYLGRREHV
ncbi:MAG: ATP-binding cassette domain-containing protein [Roseibium sp.]|uniref:ATP-binding cassette domain-containing protein n=1 Tax=Roseibium sp. TaxID=1936156 RepID=UPI002609FD5B|nr:ATP-binding cassette domain-containing protein [Roseibium sp.]MCV0427533.1 ATP-binding cassette domain-containing protein [Roseibium sp.]